MSRKGSMSLSRDKSVIPALMFHSVGLEHHPWAWNYISESVSTFERKIALLKESGFTGVFWRDLYEHMAGTRILPENSILLTFDDGYLDNWVFVHPILRKYGMKGTIFVSPEFVDPATDVRPTLDDVRTGRCDERDLQVAGFLSWAEMREMVKAGWIDIQSHAMTHTWYFSGPRIKSFHAPHRVTPNPWLFWNARPDRKPFYLNEDQQQYVPWGYPILEHGKSLETRRFTPNPSAIEVYTSLVAEQGGPTFFERADWRDILARLSAEQFHGGHLPGEYESDDEWSDRVTEELARSKRLIETNVGAPVDFLCWPGGAYDDQAREIARRVGYKASTLSSRSPLRKRNRPGVDPSSIRRIGTTNKVHLKGRTVGHAGAKVQLWRVLEHQGSKRHSLMLKVHRLIAFAASLGGIR